MYKMLIADDEALSRYAFRTLVLKNFDKIQVIGEAESGRQAIKMSREHNPDIIVMDIKMPGINGLDASFEILKDIPSTKILIVTAYDNFGYIQQALDMGVKGYLLKPINKEEALEKINKLLQGVDDTKSTIDHRKSEINKMNTVKPFIEKELIQAFITGNVDIEEVKSYLNFLQYKIDRGYFMLISLGASYSNYINDSVRNKFYFAKVQDVVLEHMPRIKRCIFGNAIGNVLNLLIPLDSTCSPENSLRESLLLAEEIKRKIKIITGIEVSIGIGNIHNDINEFKLSYDEARFALKQAINNSTIMHFNSVKDDFISSIPQYPIKYEIEFLEQLRIGNTDKAEELAEIIITYVFNDYYSIDMTKEYVSQLVTILKRTIWQMEVETSSLNDMGSLIELNGLTDLNEIEVWCKRCIYAMIHEVKSKRTKRNNGQLNRVYELINRQFNKDVTLEMAAGEVGFSPQYFSKLFKEEYGTNFIDYITHKKINMAKNLLESGNKSIKDISKSVGYTDTNYFSRIFKKHTGLTPKQYRSKILHGK